MIITHTASLKRLFPFHEAVQTPPTPHPQDVLKTGFLPRLLVAQTAVYLE